MTNMRDSATSFPIEGDLTHSPAGERYVEVVARLLAVEGSSRQVLVTSPGAAEGKTVTAVNLAFAFHTQLVSVLLAELSLARPYFSQVFGASPLSNGIEDVLAKKLPLQSAVCVRNDNNLSLTMVNKPQKTNDLLALKEQLDRLLMEARSGFDWTIFDGPSVESTPDIRSLANDIGLVVLVARAGRTTQKTLMHAVERISHPNTFVLLNDN